MSNAGQQQRHKYMDKSLDEMIAREGITGAKRKDNGNDAEDESPPPKRGGFSAKTSASNRSAAHFDDNCGAIWASNLKFEVNDDDVQQLFSAFGTLKRAAVNYQRDGRSSGTAFVVFANRRDAVKAIGTLKGFTLDGRPLNLELIDRNGEPSAQSTQGSTNKRSLWNDIATNYDNTHGSGGDSGKRSDSTRGGPRWGRGERESSKISADDLDADLESYLASRSASK